MPAEITSRKNEEVRSYLQLSGSASFRRETHCFSAEGARLCSDAAASNVKIFTLFSTVSASEKYGSYLAEIRKVCGKEYTVSPSVAEYMAQTKNPQGVFCVCGMPENPSNFPETEGGKHMLLLENMQDPANVGAVFRTAEALGIGGVLLCGNCCDAFSPKVLRASMGAVFRLPLYRREDAPETVRALNDSGFQTLAAVPDATAQKITSLFFENPCTAVIGNEGNGLTEATKSACSLRVTIPMLGRAESLNAAASAAILMWEMMRGKSKGGRS